MFEKPTSVRPLSKPTNRFSQVALDSTGLRPRTPATSRPRSGSAPVSDFWSVPTNASGGKPAGSAPTPIRSSPLSRIAVGSAFRMESTCSTASLVSLNGAPVLAATETSVLPVPTEAAVPADPAPPQPGARVWGAREPWALRVPREAAVRADPAPPQPVAASRTAVVVAAPRARRSRVLVLDMVLLVEGDGRAGVAGRAGGGQSTLLRN